MKKLRIGIIGAGTAGLASAIAQARNGHEVHVYEKHPSLCTLGAGVLIQPQGVDALNALGVGAAFEQASVPVTRLHGVCSRGWPLVDIEYKDVRARGVSRSALGNVLLPAALREGAQVHFGQDIESIGVRDRRASFAGRDFDLAVIANGASSRLTASAGLAVRADKYRWGALWGMFDIDDPDEPTLLAQRYDGTRKMYGIMPTERVNGKLRISFFWSLPADQYETWRSRPVAEFRAELLALWPESHAVANQIVAHEQLTFATYYHARPHTLAKPPVCIIGDAAHAMSPQLGLGTTLAVQDALALANAVEEFGAIDGLRHYARRRLIPVRAYQMFSKALTPCFQADAPGLWRDALFATGLYIPGVRTLMYRSIAAPHIQKPCHARSSPAQRSQ
jgi:2-polyprenyl-6-methoxyphenol hydroxylase-like FAD-dependent oxidoreductase